MTAIQIVDKLFEAGPVDPGEFLSGFPTKRAGRDDIVRVMRRLLELKAEHGGWSTSGAVDVTILDGTPIEKVAQYPDAYNLDTTGLSFESLVMTEDGREVRSFTEDGHYYGWYSYMPFREPFWEGDNAPLNQHLKFGVFVNGDFYEHEIPAEALAICKENYEQFNKEFIEPAMWINESRKDGPSPKGWIQIGGDFGDAWSYGGTWFNPQSNDMIHFPGLDYEAKEIEADDKRVDSKLTRDNYKFIVAQLHLDDTDKWESAEDEIRSEYASQLNDERRFQYFRTSVETDEWIEKDWASEIEAIKQELEISDEDWAKTEPQHKESAIADRIGWHEFDHYPENISRKELSELLGIEL